jgi:hypothetical protein
MRLLSAKAAESMQGDEPAVESSTDASGGVAATIETQTTPSGETVVEVIKDVEAPSQNAVDAVRGINKFLERGEMDEKQFERLTEDVTRLIYDFALQAVPQGKSITGQVVSKTIDSILDYLQTGAIEIGGEQIKVGGAASIIITQDVYEAMMRQKQMIAEMLQKRDQRLNTPQARAVEEIEKVLEPTVDCTKCNTMTTIFNVLHGGVQFACGHIFTMPPDSNKLIYDDKRTKAHPIESMKKVEEVKETK